MGFDFSQLVTEDADGDGKISVQGDDKTLLVRITKQNNQLKTYSGDDLNKPLEQLGFNNCEPFNLQAVIDLNVSTAYGIPKTGHSLQHNTANYRTFWSSSAIMISPDYSPPNKTRQFGVQLNHAPFEISAFANAKFSLKPACAKVNDYDWSVTGPADGSISFSKATATVTFNKPPVNKDQLYTIQAKPRLPGFVELKFSFRVIRWFKFLDKNDNFFATKRKCERYRDNGRGYKMSPYKYLTDAAPHGNNGDASSPKGRFIGPLLWNFWGNIQSYPQSVIPRTGSESYYWTSDRAINYGNHQVVYLNDGRLRQDYDIMSYGTICYTDL